jgi:hypothetical protein
MKVDSPAIGAGGNRLRFPGVLGLFMLCRLLTAPAAAQVAIAAQPETDASLTACVDVAINDHPALSYDCLNRRLRMGDTRSAGQVIDVDAVAREPGNRQVGQYNFSSLSHRMGSNLGHSVMPQRPPPAPRVVIPVPLGTH